jgi:hypothetical protein
MHAPDDHVIQVLGLTAQKITEAFAWNHKILLNYVLVYNSRGVHTYPWTLFGDFEAFSPCIIVTPNAEGDSGDVARLN